MGYVVIGGILLAIVLIVRSMKPHKRQKETLDELIERLGRR